MSTASLCGQINVFGPNNIQRSWSTHSIHQAMQEVACKHDFPWTLFSLILHLTSSAKALEENCVCKIRVREVKFVGWLDRDGQRRAKRGANGAAALLLSRFSQLGRAKILNFSVCSYSVCVWENSAARVNCSENLSIHVSMWDWKREEEFMLLL